MRRIQREEKKKREIERREKIASIAILQKKITAFENINSDSTFIQQYKEFTQQPIKNVTISEIDNRITQFETEKKHLEFITNKLHNLSENLDVTLRIVFDPFKETLTDMTISQKLLEIHKFELLNNKLIKLERAKQLINVAMKHTRNTHEKQQLQKIIEKLELECYQKEIDLTELQKIIDFFQNRTNLEQLCLQFKKFGPYRQTKQFKNSEQTDQFSQIRYFKDKKRKNTMEQEYRIEQPRHKKRRI